MNHSKWLLLFVGCSGLISCSHLFLNDEDTYERGNSAIKEQQYEQASQEFRKIPITSALYSSALRQIERIPLEKGKQLLQEKKYAEAQMEFEKIPVQSSFYSEAQTLLNQARFDEHFYVLMKEGGIKTKSNALKNLVDLVTKQHNSLLLENVLSQAMNFLKA